MGLLQLILGGQQSAANPAEDWLKARYPDLFKNGERLPAPPPGWSPPKEDGELPPVASNASAPSNTGSTGGTTGAPVGGAQDGPVSEQPAPRADAATPHKRGGVLGALKSVFMPDAGSFMYAALNNPNGLWGARGAQQEYQQAQATNALNTQMAQLKLDQLRTKGEYQIVGNNVFHIKPDGTTEMISAPAQPTETQRLIDQWRATPPGPEKDLIERAIRGYQYTPGVINAQANARQRVQAAGIAQRGAEARKTKATPGASSGGSGGAKLPTGFILNP